jgi:hypothetical protein
MHTSTDSPVFWALYLELNGRLYIMLAFHALSCPLWIPSHFNLLLIVCLCIYRVTPHPDSDLAIMFPNPYTFIHMPISNLRLIEKTLISSSGSPFDFLEGLTVGNGIPIDKFDRTSGRLRALVPSQGKRK